MIGPFGADIGSRVARRPLRATAAVGVVVLAAAASANGWEPGSPTQALASTPAGAPPVAAAIQPVGPNIVYVLTDDLSLDLVRHLSQVRAMKSAGTSFRNAIVADSLCCPSRASILTGLMPHNTRVRANDGRHGGYQSFIDPNRDGSFEDGQHRLKRGKGTPYETDIRVPLVVTGPEAVPGQVRDEVVQNVDLSATFQQLARADVRYPGDGRGLAPLLHGGHQAWREVALIEHISVSKKEAGPDSERSTMQAPT